MLHHKVLIVHRARIIEWYRWWHPRAKSMELPFSCCWLELGVLLNFEVILKGCCTWLNRWLSSPLAGGRLCEAVSWTASTWHLPLRPSQLKEKNLIATGITLFYYLWSIYYATWKCYYVCHSIISKLWSLPLKGRLFYWSYKYRVLRYFIQHWASIQNIWVNSTNTLH